MVGEERREKVQYVKPTNKEEALKVLENLPTEIYSRLKGRTLGLIEKWFAGKIAEEQAAKDSFLLLLSSISGSVTRKVADCLEVLQSKK